MIHDDNASHPARLSGDELLRECEVKRVRRSGPGGQRRNKVETGVVLTHPLTGVTAEAAERRSQAENQKQALFRLRIKLALQVRRAISGESAPSELWRSRCRGGRIAASAQHEDFPALLAEALDVLRGHGWEARGAAADLGCTASQLLKFLKREPAALELVNRERTALGLRRLR